MKRLRLLHAIRVPRAVGVGFDEAASIDDGGHLSFVEHVNGMTVVSQTHAVFVPWSMVRSVETVEPVNAAKKAKR